MILSKQKYQEANDTVKYISLQIVMCKNETNGQRCKSPDEIDKFLAATHMRLFVNMEKIIRQNLKGEPKITDQYRVITSSQLH